MNEGIIAIIREAKSSTDLEDILKLKELLDQAKSDVKVISDTYLFSIGETEKVLWKDDHNSETLTFDGYWKAKYLHQSYTVQISVERIFNLYKAEYLAKKNWKTSTNNLAEAAEYFREFVRQTRKGKFK